MAGLLSFGLSGCMQLAVMDATLDPVYRPLLGREYVLKEEFLIRGVKHDHRSLQPDYILLMPPPGIGGRFITDLGRLPRGSRFRITGVVTRRSKLFPATEYVVSPTDGAGAGGIPVRLSSTAAWGLYRPPATTVAPPQLNARYFHPVPERRP